MNMKHTPGPWIAKEQYRDCVTNDVGHFVMWQDRSKPGVMLRRLDDKKGAFSAADALRITSCVNACTGMPFPTQAIREAACLIALFGTTGTDSTDALRRAQAWLKENGFSNLL